jgi:hypothetical protein
MVEDTSVNSVPQIHVKNDARDWYLDVAGAGGTSNDEFRVVDGTGGTAPIVVKAGAPSNNLVLDGTNARVGINTAFPSHELHVTGASDTMVYIESEGTSQNAGITLVARTSAPADYSLAINNVQGNYFRIYDGTGGKTIFDLQIANVANNAFVIGNTASQILTLTSTTQALLLPRMTTAQMNAIAAPVNGMIIYNTTVGAVYGYEAGAWANL